MMELNDRSIVKDLFDPSTIIGNKRPIRRSIPTFEDFLGLRDEGQKEFGDLEILSLDIRRFGGDRLQNHV